MSRTAPHARGTLFGFPATLPRSTGHMDRSLPARLLTAPPCDLWPPPPAQLFQGRREADRAHRMRKALPLALLSEGRPRGGSAKRKAYVQGGLTRSAG
jgi:hypothetical protein